jgi:hypothetical protein
MRLQTDNGHRTKKIDARYHWRRVVIGLRKQVVAHISQKYKADKCAVGRIFNSIPVLDVNYTRRYLLSAM